LMPVNTNAVFPSFDGDNLEVPNVSYTQFLSPHFGVFLGKIATISSTSGDMNAFAHGKGDSNFMNLAFNVNPVSLITPYSALGGGVVIMPGKDPEDATISLSILDAEGNPGTAGFDTVFEGGTVYSTEARLRTHFFGKTGHQLIGGGYSDKLYTSLDQNFRYIIENRRLKATSGAWCVYYNFDQYLYEPEEGSGKGWGVFGRAGVSDGDPNPLEYFWSIGIGGKGLIPGRANDGFGIGIYDIITSNTNVTSFVGLNDEWGVEAFYNIALTPSAQFSPDIQYIDGAGPNSDAAVILGLRLKLVF
ncbi:MAG: carbohydrate porin, partial [Tepidisphaeraceae bacterium]